MVADPRPIRSHRNATVSNVAHGNPFLDGRRLEIPVITNTAHHQSLTVDTTTNLGKTLTPLAAPLNIPQRRSAGDVIPSAAGSTIWMPAQGRTYESRNNGATWTAVKSAISPTTISLVNPTVAIGTAVGQNCPTRQHECLIKTTDSGRTWRTI